MPKILRGTLEYNRIFDEDTLVFCGEVKTGSIKADNIIVIGRIDVRDYLQSRNLLVVGSIHAREVRVLETTLLKITSPSIIMDLYTHNIRVRVSGRGRVSIGFLYSERANLSGVFIHRMKAPKILILGDRCVIENIEGIGELLVFKSPYSTFRVNVNGLYKRIMFHYNTL